MENARPPAFRVDRNIRWLTRHRDALLKKLGQVGVFTSGSVVPIARTCGNSQYCRCSRGEKHVDPYLCYTEAGQRRNLYLPVALREDVNRWAAEYRKVKGLVREISQTQKEIIRRYVTEQRRRARAQGA